MKTTAKLFVNGRSQAVRISYADEAPLVDDAFMADRPRLMESGRVVF